MTREQRAQIIRRLERIIHITHVALFFAAGALLLALWRLNGLVVIVSYAVLFGVATLIGRTEAKRQVRREQRERSRDGAR